MLEAKLAAGDWPAALALMQGALERKIISPIVAERARAGLLTASAASREGDDDERVRAAALDDAQTAARLAPGFAPAAVVAARLLADDGRAARAAQTLEAAWKVAAHRRCGWPTATCAPTRRRANAPGALASLAAFNPDTREARILMAEQALIAGDAVGARAAGKSLQHEPLTRRLAGLFARIASAAGDRDEARAWPARGAEAPQEPDWSDLDPEGPRLRLHPPATGPASPRPMPSAANWSTPGSSGASAASATCRSCPAAYVESTPFISAAESGAPSLPIVDDSDFGLELDPAEADPTPRSAHAACSAALAAKTR
ncbi:MAG: hypothetical protein WDM85_09300 [Caulobacteraceae bacterium]